jgi:hypothetical protein
MTILSKTLLPLVLLAAMATVVTAVETEGDQAMPANDHGLDLLFIHHSTGGTLFAEPGERVGGERGSGERCIYVSHPNGGGLRARLEQAGYHVHEASYESTVGDDTDFCHWRQKFANQMDRILVTDHQDETFAEEGRTNDIVLFKSCFPNNKFESHGTEPGDPDDCTRTVANARAAYNALLPLFREQPDVLFVALTAPPMAEYKPVGMKQTIKSWFQDNSRGGDLALEFNAWMTDRENGWLAGYDLPNVQVFDYYGVLSEGNEKGYSSYASRGGRDSHPSSDGNQNAADAFMPFIEAAVAGMDWPQP